MDQKTNSIIKIYQRLWSHISKQRKIQFIFLCLLIFLASLAEMVSVGAIGPYLLFLTDPNKIYENKLGTYLIDFFNLSEPGQLMLLVTILFGMFGLIAGFIRLSLMRFQVSLCQAVGVEISVEMYEKALYQSYSWHIQKNTSEIISGITFKTYSIVAFALTPILNVIGSIWMLSMVLTAILMINFYVALITFFCFASIYLLVIYFTKKNLKKNSEIVNHESSKVLKILQEGLGGVRDVLLDGTQQTFVNLYRSSEFKLRQSMAEVQVIGASPRFLIEALGVFLIAFIAFFLSRESNGLVGAIPILGALALGALRILPMLQQLYSSWTAFVGGRSSILDALDMLDSPKPSRLSINQIEPLKFQKEIEFINVEYRYAGSESLAINDINLTIPKGSRIGIMGETGGGKSTLTDVLMGLLIPVSGKILIDGCEINEANIRSWQLNIAHVPQAIYLADVSIIENIAFGVPFSSIDIPSVKKAAKMAKISDVIERLPEKYNTKVGERGIKLSGGQRQRIGIARALYKNAEVIVFDEATSALDINTEIDVIQSIQMLDKNITLVMIAHRLKTLAQCDFILELKDGKIKNLHKYSDIEKN
jgi:ABC-type multidrug transport system fused ATPase/permease subunit